MHASVIPKSPLVFMTKVSLTQFDPSQVLSSVSPFRPLVNPADFLSHSVTLLLMGFCLLVALISYEVTHPTIKSRSLVKELSLAASTSVLLGSGALMAMLASGLYV